jgi:putative membrane protein
MGSPTLAAIAFGAGCLLGAAAAAQETPSTSPSPTPIPSTTPAPTRTPGAARPPSSRDEIERLRRNDARFASNEHLRGLEEVEIGQILARRSSNPRVRSVAQRIVEERGKADEDLRLFADGQGIRLAAALDAQRRAEIDRISRLPAEELDRAAVAALLRAHAADVAALQGQTRMGQEVDLQAWVSNTLELLEDQQEEIREVAAELGIPKTPEHP